DYYDKGELQFHTAIWGISEPLNNRTLLTALLKQPMLTLGVMLRIHWQALRLWSKGVSLTTRSSSMEETAK
ncbi:MAG: DUF1365 family protein, partial [Candidatus Thiodiazotropha sp.]